MNFQGRRVVITGLGAVSPVGLTASSSWDALVNGRSGIGPITAFDASAYPVRIEQYGFVSDTGGAGFATIVPPPTAASICRRTSEKL